MLVSPPKPKLQSAAFSTNAAFSGNAWALFVPGNGAGPFRIYGIEIALQTAVQSHIGLVRTTDNGTKTGYTVHHRSENGGLFAPAYQPEVWTQWSVQPTPSLFNAPIPVPAWQRKRVLAGTVGQSLRWDFLAGFDVRSDNTPVGVGLFNYGPATGAILDVSYWFETHNSSRQGASSYG